MTGQTDATRIVRGHSIRTVRTEEEIRADLERIGGELRRLARGRVPVFIALLKGSFVFLADLVRAYGEAHEIDFLSVTRYDPARKDTASVRVLHDLSANISGRLVVVVEAIRTKGHKIEYIDSFLRLRGPEEILYCACVRQQGSAGGPIPLHHWGFEIEDDDYVIGYGLDLDEQYRNLPFIGTLEGGHETGRAG
jgi:hypoxanthine phosphoribosyltransferase